MDRRVLCLYLLHNNVSDTMKVFEEDFIHSVPTYITYFRLYATQTLTHTYTHVHPLHLALVLPRRSFLMFLLFFPSLLHRAGLLHG